MMKRLLVLTAFITSVIFTSTDQSSIRGTKIFVNPGIGVSRSFSPKIEGTLGAGLMMQMGDDVFRTSFSMPGSDSYSVKMA